MAVISISQVSGKNQIEFIGTNYGFNTNWNIGVRQDGNEVGNGYVDGDDSQYYSSVVIDVSANTGTLNVIYEAVDENLEILEQGEQDISFVYVPPVHILVAPVFSTLSLNKSTVTLDSYATSNVLKLDRTGQVVLNIGQNNSYTIDFGDYSIFTTSIQPDNTTQSYTLTSKFGTQTKTASIVYERFGEPVITIDENQIEITTTTLDEWYSLAYRYNENQDWTYFDYIQSPTARYTLTNSPIDWTVGSTIQLAVKVGDARYPYANSISEWSNIVEWTVAGRVNKPTLTIDGDILSWNNVSAGATYVIYVNGQSTGVNTTQLSYNLSTLIPTYFDYGESVEISIFVNPVESYLDGIESDSIVYIKNAPILTAPVISISENVISWNPVLNANLYRLYANDVVEPVWTGRLTSVNCKDQSLIHGVLGDGDTMELYLIAYDDTGVYTESSNSNTVVYYRTYTPVISMIGNKIYLSGVYPFSQLNIYYTNIDNIITTQSLTSLSSDDVGRYFDVTTLNVGNSSSIYVDYSYSSGLSSFSNTVVWYRTINAPVITLSENIISWSAVDNANTYGVYVRNNVTSQWVNVDFISTTSFDLNSIPNNVVEEGQIVQVAVKAGNTSNITNLISGFSNIVTWTKESSSTNFNIVFNLTGITYNGSYIIEEGGIVNGTLIANSGFSLPTNISVSNATYTYNPTTGAISISNPTGTVTVIAIGAAEGLKIFLYQNTAENNRVDKTAFLTLFEELNGTLREPCSIISPSITVQLTKLPNFNYVYIPIFNRYYYVTNLVFVTNELVNISMRCDVLMSFKQYIYQQEAYVGRQEFDFNVDIIDNKLPVETGTQVKKLELNPTTLTYITNLERPLFDIDKSYVILQTVRGYPS